MLAFISPKPGGITLYKTASQPAQDNGHEYTAAITTTWHWRQIRRCAYLVTGVAALPLSASSIAGPALGLIALVQQRVILLWPHLVLLDSIRDDQPLLVQSPLVHIMILQQYRCCLDPSFRLSAS